MASWKGAAAEAESKSEEMSSDGEWIEVELDADWVFVDPEENLEHAREGPNYNGGTVVAADQDVHMEEPDVSGDGNEHRNTHSIQKTNKERYVDEGAYGFSAHDEITLRFPPASENYAYSGTHGFSEGVCEGCDNKGTPRLSDDALSHGHFEGTYKEEKDEGAHRLSVFLEAGPCEGDDKVAHGLSHESGISEGACEDDEDAQENSNVESTYRFSEDTCEEEEEEEEEEDEDEDVDDDEYGDAVHEGALQDAVNKCAPSLMDAMERYNTNPVRECWQEYICSVQTKTRKELHKEKMASFQGYGPQPKAFIKGSKCFNPLFEEVWLPWAINAEYCHNEDLGLLVCDGATGCTQRTLAAQRYMSSAVPILPVLEYMVYRAPGKKIAHIGSCSSLYWAALLQGLGAANVIVTEGRRPITWAPVGYPHIQEIGEEMFFMLNMMSVDQALFLLRPPKRSSDAEPCMVERCLFCFPGDTIFFVGESGKGADNFDMAQWVEEHELEGWHVEKEMEIPCWPGSHDLFLCITKASLPDYNTT